MSKENSARRSARRMTTALPAAGAVGLAVLAAFGWLFEEPLLAALLPNYIPMAPATALVVLLLGSNAFLPSLIVNTVTCRRLAQINGAVVLLVTAVVLLKAINGFPGDFEGLLVAATPHAATGVAAGRMSPYTAILAGGLGGAMFLRGRCGRNGESVAAALECSILLATLLLVMAYLYHTPYFYGGAQIPVALTTALALALLAVSAISAAGIQHLPLSLLAGTPTQNRLMAGLLPVIAATLLTALLLAFIADQASRYVALLSSAATVGVLFACCLWAVRFARRTGAVIDEAGAETLRLKNYLANIVDSMPEILVGVDNERIVTQWNLHATAITGISRDEAIGKPFSQLLPAFSPWVEILHRDIEARRPVSMEKLLLEENGERHFFDLMLYPLTANCVIGTVVRIEDVTERARIEEMMIQTEKMMSVGGLAAGIAHEINNPLGVVTQAAQNVERRLLGDVAGNRAAAAEVGLDLELLQRYLEQRQIPRLLEAIRSAVARSARIVSGMLQFSRQSGTTPTTVQPVELLEAAIELAGSDYDLKKKYDFRAIVIERDYANDLPQISANAIEIEQVILNLLKNAAQAMIENPPERPPRLQLRLYHQERWLVLEVADNGPGMSEAVRRRVFEPFFTTKDPGVGTGLGLSVSFTIVTHNHRGLIEVESTPGNGARFIVRLPLGNTDREGSVNTPPARRPKGDAP